MDFIERIFHISPDGGNGLWELAIALLVLMPLVIAGVSRALAKRSAQLGS